MRTKTCYYLHYLEDLLDLYLKHKGNIQVMGIKEQEANLFLEHDINDNIKNTFEEYHAACYEKHFERMLGFISGRKILADFFLKIK